MSMAVTDLAAAAADERMTAHRRELKCLITIDQARAVARAAQQALSAHRHRGEGANLLPAAQHWVTTIYFDTPSRQLFRDARTSSDNHLKLRAKEYYDVHPNLTETATDARQLVRYHPALMLEIKSKDGGFTGKQRIAVPKRDIPAFFADRTITPAMTSLQDREVLAHLAALFARLGEPLHADCLVNYRRSAWQDADGHLRVTIDSQLGFFAPPADLWDRDFALVRQSLGPARAVDERRVLEIKTQGELPRWLTELLSAQGIVAIPFSKFEAASSAVHG